MMTNIDRKRDRGVELLERIGFRWDGAQWLGPRVIGMDVVAEADRLHGLLDDRAEALAGDAETDNEDELATIGEALEAYEARRGGGPKARSLAARADARE